ncbi:MAG: FHA domain-containing protein [bacterium]
MDRQIKILFLAANPHDASPLRLDEEIRAVDQALRQADFRDMFDIKQFWAVRVTDLQNYFLRYNPDLVHFSGHGSLSSEIILEDNDGNSQPVPCRALSRLFSILKDNIRCVFLNACYSERQAHAIAEHIDCVIGMSNAIGDRAAISFTAAFYQALGFGRNIKTAFDLGCLQIDLERMNEQNTPKLLCLNCHPKEIVFASSGLIQNKTDAGGGVAITASLDEHCRPATKAQPQSSTKIERANELRTQNPFCPNGIGLLEWIKRREFQERMDKMNSQTLGFIEIESGTQKGKKIEIHPGCKITFGRSRNSDVCISDKTVSRTHAELRMYEDGIFFKNIGINGTLVDSRRIHHHEIIQLNNSVPIEIGGCKLNLDISDFENTMFINRAMSLENGNEKAGEISQQKVPSAEAKLIKNVLSQSKAQKERADVVPAIANIEQRQRHLGSGHKIMKKIGTVQLIAIATLLLAGTLLFLPIEFPVVVNTYGKIDSAQKCVLVRG